MFKDKLVSFSIILFSFLFILMTGILSIDAFAKGANDNNSSVKLENPVKIIYFAEEKLTLVKDTSASFEIKSKYDIDISKIKYNILDEEIAIVENNQIKSLKEGTTKLIASYDNYSDELEINVTNEYFKVTLNYGKLNIMRENIKCPIIDGVCHYKLKTITSDNYDIVGWSLEKRSNKILNNEEILKITEDTTLYLITN